VADVTGTALWSARARARQRGEPFYFAQHFFKNAELQILE
jgi:hypothetical protein